ncbi:MAG: methylated-DNA--[protein]-cysteine S-methyltransferase [Burkholderiaceae bacterium]
MVAFASLTYTVVSSPLGRLTLAASAAGLAGVWFDGQRHRPPALAAQPIAWPRDDVHPLLQAVAAQLQAYWRGQVRAFDLPLDLSAGTPFQQAVWRALCKVPYGGTVAYGELARQLGQPRAVRALGAAVGRNPLCVVVPCHRVVGAGGALTGYAAGLERKQALLQLEGEGALPSLESPFKSPLAGATT